MVSRSTWLKGTLLVVSGLLLLGLHNARRQWRVPAADPGFPPVTFRPLGAPLESPGPGGSPPLPFARLPNNIAVALASGFRLGELRCMLDSFSSSVRDHDAGLVLLVSSPPAGWEQLTAGDPRIRLVQYTLGSSWATPAAVYVLRHLVTRSFLQQLRGTMRVVVFDARDTVFQLSPFRDPRWPSDSGAAQVGAPGAAAGGGGGLRGARTASARRGGGG
jgi:hypothetical protein